MLVIQLMFMFMFKPCLSEISTWMRRLRLCHR